MALVLMSYCFVNAQVYKYNGTIINANNDTIQARIKSGYKLQNKSKVTYKEVSNGSRFTSGSPDEILFYSHDKDSYQSVSINGKRVFIRTNVIGHVSLYETVDEKAEKFFYLKKGQGEYELVDQANLDTFLKNYFGDCNSASLEKALGKVRFTRFRLANLVSQYNACKFPDKYVAVNFSPLHHAKLSAVAGFQIVNLRFPFTFSSQGSSSGSTDLQPTIGLNLLFEGERRISSGLEVNFKKYDFELNFDSVLPENLIGSETMRSYESTSLDVSFFLRYKILEAQNIYLRFGPLASFYDVAATDDPMNTIIQDPNPILYGLMFGGSYQITHKIGAQLDYRYSSGSGIFRFQNNTKTNVVSFLLRYKFN